MTTPIRPIAETADSVTLRRADYEALVEAIEDAEDAAALREVEARLGAGETEEIPIEMAERLLEGASPVRVWREHRGLSQGELARRAGVGVSYLSEIETGRKPGSLDAVAKLARALGVAVDDLVGWRSRS
jgi:ribosome-binding protein aMBF1 (putative translation factor)